MFRFIIISSLLVSLHGHAAGKSCSQVFGPSTIRTSTTQSSMDVVRRIQEKFDLKSEKTETHTETVILVRDSARNVRSAEQTLGSAKNDLIKMFSTALMNPGVTIIRHVPRNMTDVINLIAILKNENVVVRLEEEPGFPDLVQVKIDPRRWHEGSGEYSMLKPEVEKLRASINMWGPMVGRLNHPHVSPESFAARSLFIKTESNQRTETLESFPCGGCGFGDRPFNFFLQMFSEAGVKINLEMANEAGQTSMVPFSGQLPRDGRITRIQFKADQELRPIDYATEKVSVGLTETFLLFALNINGVSRLRNAALEPEIINIINFLNESWGTTVINVNEGRRTITVDPSGQSMRDIPSRPPQRPLREMPVVEYVPLPDRINFAQYVSLALESQRPLTLNRVSLQAIENSRNMYAELGIEIKPVGFPDSNGFYTVQINPPRTLKATNNPIVFRPYPDLPTDIKDHVKYILARFGQPGHRYEVHEYVYTSRFDSNIFLRLFGARVEYEPFWNEGAQRWDAQGRRDNDGETHSVEYIVGGSMRHELNVTTPREPDFYVQNLNDLRLAHMNIYALARSQSENGRVYALTRGGIPLRGATTKMFTDFLNSQGNPSVIVNYATPAQVRAMESHPHAVELYRLLSHGNNEAQ